MDVRSWKFLVTLDILLKFLRALSLATPTCPTTGNSLGVPAVPTTGVYKSEAATCASDKSALRRFVLKASLAAYVVFGVTAMSLNLIIIVLCAAALYITKFLLSRADSGAIFSENVVALDEITSGLPLS